mmetsp:Transcript_45838/g.130870  ORF Transcript_45838/g.130870 Transcript_45838/m.130870 type:complete len:1393 (+) Transcript_45838:130-4308(+)
MTTSRPLTGGPARNDRRNFFPPHRLRGDRGVQIGDATSRKEDQLALVLVKDDASDDSVESVQEREKDTVTMDTVFASLDTGMVQRAEERGIPFNELQRRPAHEQERELEKLLAKIETLETKTASKLLLEYESLGYVADDLLPREELRDLVKDALIWNQMNSKALHKVCLRRGLEVDASQPRAELLQLLQESTWEALGIPISRYPSSEVARKVLEQVRNLENHSFSDLLQGCRQRNISTEAIRARATQDSLAGKLSRLLKQSIIWKKLPLEELRRECRARGVPPEADPALPEDRASDQLYARLLASLGGGQEPGRGLERLRSPELAEELAERLDRLQVMGALSLRAECRRLGIDCQVHTGNQALVDRIREVLIWQHMTLEDLKEDCRERKVFFLEGDNRETIIKGLLDVQDRHAEMELLGVPKQLLRDDSAAKELYEQYKEVDTMALADLTLWYNGTVVFPSADHLQRGDLQKLLKKVMAWELLPADELRQECLRSEVPAGAAGSDDDPEDEEQLQDLIRQLILHEVVEVITLDGLLDWYDSFGSLPSARGLPRADLQKLLRKLISWTAQPLDELRQEGERMKVPVGDAPEPGLEEEQRSALVWRLILRECVEVLPTESLQEWYESMGLPPAGGIKRPELQQLLRKYVSWQGMPLEDLQVECTETDVPMCATSFATEEEQQVFLVNRLALCECIEVFPIDDLVEWYEGMGYTLVSRSIKRKELQKLLRKIMRWEAMPLSELREEYTQLDMLPIEAAACDDDQALQQLLVQRLAIHERIEGMSPIELGEWYTGTGLPLEKGMKRTELQKVLKQVLAWQSAPLGQLEGEVERLQEGASRILEAEDEDEQRAMLIDKLFFQDRMAAWESRGFQAQRIGDVDKVRQIVDCYTVYEKMADHELKVQYTENLGFPDERGMDRAERLETVKKMLIWEVLPFPELLKDCEDQGRPIQASEDEEEKRPEIIYQLVYDMRAKQKPHLQGRLGGRARLPRSLDKGAPGNAPAAAPNGGAPAPQSTASRKPGHPVDDRPPADRPPAQSPAPASNGLTGGSGGRAGSRDDGRAAVAESGTAAPAAGPSNAGDRASVRLRDHHGAGGGHQVEELGVQTLRVPQHIKSNGNAIVNGSAAGQPPTVSAGKAAAKDTLDANSKLQHGICLFINLDRRADRKQRMEELFAPHKWLSSTAKRLSAVDKNELEWSKLVSDRLITQTAQRTAARAEREKRATIGARPHECSEHLTLGGCGCALSHRKAWQTLVDSNSRWALILEDDLTKICENFDEELERVFAELPGDWGMCYLGFHGGKVLRPGRHFQGPLRELCQLEGWLPGLYGYLITKSCARYLQKSAFPLAAQVDTVVGCLVQQRAGTFVVPETEFLLFSPPTEESGDTDVQTFPKDLK